MDIPPLDSPVIDQAGLLAPQEKLQLEQQLWKLQRSGKMQGQILIINSLMGEPIENFSIRVTDQWKLGDQKKDNGWLLLVSYQDRSMRLEVGQGLEGYITDIRAGRIIEEMKGYFRNGDFYSGLSFALNKINSWVEGKDYVGDETANPWGVKKGIVFMILFFVVSFILFVFGRLNSLSRSPTATSYRSRRGGWMDDSFGSGGGSSWGGGGGGFSGGGSSGKW